MQKVKYGDDCIYIDTDEVTPEETGIIIKEDSLDDTSKIKVIDKEDILSNTNLDIFKEDNHE